MRITVFPMITGPRRPARPAPVRRRVKRIFVCAAVFSGSSPESLVMNRRTLLASIGGALTGATLPGCLGAGNPPAGTPTPTPTGPTTTPTPTSPPPATDTLTADFSVRSRNCGTGDHQAAVTRTGDTVTVDGVIRGSDTCDTGELDTVRFKAGTLTVAVITVKEGDDTTGCAQCLTDIDYTASIEVGHRTVEEIAVTHDGETIVTTAP